MSLGRRRMALIFTGAALVLAAVLFPYETAFGAAGHDLLTYRVPGVGSSGAGDRLHFCVSDFEILGDRTIGFRVGDSSGLPAGMAPPDHMTGQDIVMSADSFWLQRNSPEC